METALETYVDGEYMPHGIFDTTKPLFKDPSLMTKETCKSLLGHWYNRQVEKKSIVFAFKMFPGKEENQVAYPRVLKASAKHPSTSATPPPAEKEGKRKRSTIESDQDSDSPTPAASSKTKRARKEHPIGSGADDDSDGDTEVIPAKTQRAAKKPTRKGTRKGHKVKPIQDGNNDDTQNPENIDKSISMVDGQASGDGHDEENEEGNEVVKPGKKKTIKKVGPPVNSKKTGGVGKKMVNPKAATLTGAGAQASGSKQVHFEDTVPAMKTRPKPRPNAPKRSQKEIEEEVGLVISRRLRSGTQ